MNRIDFYMLLMAQPFRPFKVRMSLNIVVEVRHPETAMLEFSTVHIEAPSLPGHQTTEAIIVSLSHIITVEYLSASS